MRNSYFQFNQKRLLVRAEISDNMLGDHVSQKTQLQLACENHLAVITEIRFQSVCSLLLIHFSSFI